MERNCNCPVCGSANTRIIVQPELVPGRGAQTLIDCRDCGNTLPAGATFTAEQLTEYAAMRRLVRSQS